MNALKTIAKIVLDEILKRKSVVLLAIGVVVLLAMFGVAAVLEHSNWIRKIMSA